MTHIEKVKTHLRENKKVYIAATVGVVVGAVSVFVLKDYHGNKATIDSWKLVQWKSPHTSKTIQINIPKPGNSGNMIHCAMNDTYYPSQNQLAKALGENPATISQLINKKVPDVMGYGLKKIAENGVPLAV